MSAANREMSVHRAREDPTGLIGPASLSIVTLEVDEENAGFFPRRGQGLFRLAHQLFQQGNR